MRFQNRQPAEGLNVTPHHPVKHFLKLMLMALVFVVLVVVVMNYLGAALAKLVPFRYEAALMERVDYEFGDTSSDELTEYLNDLSSRLAEHMPIPEDMQFDVHYSKENVFNAYATLGGNIVFYRGLLTTMTSENALAMVVAHEMSHVIHRDPLAGMGGGIASMLALMMVTGSSGNGFGGDILNQTGSLTQLTFNRDMESAADAAALAGLASYYGHVNSADTLFKVLMKKRGNLDDEASDGSSELVKEWLSEFSQTHPLDQNRIDALHTLAIKNGWSESGELVPLPADFGRWLHPVSN